MESTRITAQLELELLEGSISGHITGDEGARHEFLGWLGLVAAIDSLIPDDEPQEERQ